MSLQRPLSITYHETQPFGAVGFVMEHPGYLQTDIYGARKAKKTYFVSGVYHKYLHMGEDIAAPVGTKLGAGQTGIIVQQGTYIETGEHYCLIQIRPGTVLFYTHLYKFLLGAGAKVTRGQAFALSGASGHVTGPHLHWELRHTSGTNTDVRLSYSWPRWNPVRFYDGGQYANVSWIKPL